MDARRRASCHGDLIAGELRRSAANPDHRQERPEHCSGKEAHDQSDEWREWLPLHLANRNRRAHTPDAGETADDEVAPDHHAADPRRADEAPQSFKNWKPANDHHADDLDPRPGFQGSPVDSTNHLTVTRIPGR
jgi:hypothetical protein